MILQIATCGETARGKLLLFGKTYSPGHSYHPWKIYDSNQFPTGPFLSSVFYGGRWYGTEFKSHAELRDVMHAFLKEQALEIETGARTFSFSQIHTFQIDFSCVHLAWSRVKTKNGERKWRKEQLEISIEWREECPCCGFMRVPKPEKIL